MLCLIAIVGVVAGHLLIVAEVLVTAGFLAGAAAAGAVFAHIRQRQMDVRGAVLAWCCGIGLLFLCAGAFRLMAESGLP